MSASQMIITCPGCRAKNRVQSDRLAEGPKCGRCGADLSPPESGRPVAVSDATFDREVTAANLPVLVDCWAPWCGPCKMIGPLLDELAGIYRGRLKIAKLNVDENPRTAAAFNVSSIPTLLFVKGGKVKDIRIGASSRQALMQWIDDLLAA